MDHKSEFSQKHTGITNMLFGDVERHRETIILFLLKKSFILRTPSSFSINLHLPEINHADH